MQGCTFFQIWEARPEASPKKGEAIIHGKIIVTEDGKETTPYGLIRRPSPTLFHAESGKYSWRGTKKDGSFLWRVPAGSYVMPEIQFGAFTFLKPKAGFIADSGAGAHYLGTLRIEIRSGGFLKDPVVLRVTITDEMNSAPASSLSKAPARMEKALMVHDNTIPDDLTNRAALNRAAAVMGFIVPVPR